jgi:hypothetical protein
MQEFCQQNNIRYIMLDDASLGDDGIVASHLLNSDPNDHHYDQDSYARLLIERLADAL